jgi:hypothetical protein
VNRSARPWTGSSRAGVPVRFVRAFFVPDDETCFLVFEAASAGDVQAAALLAGLRFEHVAELFGESL